MSRLPTPLWWQALVDWYCRTPYAHVWYYGGIGLVLLLMWLLVRRTRKRDNDNVPKKFELGWVRKPCWWPPVTLVVLHEWEKSTALPTGKPSGFMLRVLFLYMQIQWKAGI